MYFNPIEYFEYGVDFRIHKNAWSRDTHVYVPKMHRLEKKLVTSSTAIGHPSGQLSLEMKPFELATLSGK